jgi:hypothetical protein
MTATLIQGHATMFTVEADTLHCSRPGCHYVAKLAHHSVGERCPHCEKLEVPRPGTLERRSHQVDVAAYEGSGACSCEYFQFVLEPKLCRMPIDHQASSLLRCKHIKAARDSCLDMMIKEHKKKLESKLPRRCH